MQGSMVAYRLDGGRASDATHLVVALLRLALIDVVHT